MSRSARVLLTCLVGGIVCFAVGAKWSAPWAVDERTSLEMIDGVVEHGLPYILNGPSHAHPELQARWNTERDGRLWGSYPPAFSYLAAPFYRIGGSRAVIRGNIVLVALIAIGVWFIARRVTGSEPAAVICATATVLATPLASMGLLVSPYPLATCFLVWSVNAAIKSRDHPDRVGFTMLAGGLAGLATASHLIVFPAVVWLAVALALPWPRGDESETQRRTGWKWVDGLGVFAGASIPLAAVAVLNHHRFDTWNPITYGPCSWKRCASELYQPLGLGVTVWFVLPLVLWLAAGAALAWMVRRSSTGWLITVAVCISVLLLFPPLIERTQRILVVTAGFLLDVGFVDLVYRNYVRAHEGPGVFFGPYVVKSALQGMPFLVLALMAPVWKWRERWPLAIVGGAAAAIIGGVVLRGATQTAAHTLGYPFLYIRHLVPALPLLVVMSVAAVSDLSWRRWHATLGILLAGSLGVWLVIGETDLELLRRVVLLRGSLVLAVAALAVVAIHRFSGSDCPRSEIVAAVVVAAISFGVAVNSALDFPAVAGVVHEKDEFVERVARQTPHRFAVVGYPQQIDPLGALRRERDLEYADLFESSDPSSIEELIAWWFSDGRPVFVFLPRRSQSQGTFMGFPVQAVDEGIGLSQILETPRPRDD